MLVNIHCFHHGRFDRTQSFGMDVRDLWSSSSGCPVNLSAFLRLWSSGQTCTSWSLVWSPGSVSWHYRLVVRCRNAIGWDLSLDKSMWNWRTCLCLFLCLLCLSCSLFPWTLQLFSTSPFVCITFCLCLFKHTSFHLFMLSLSFVILHYYIFSSCLIVLHWITACVIYASIFAIQSFPFTLRTTSET